MDIRYPITGKHTSMKLEGTQVLPVTGALARQKLADVPFLASCVPGLEKLHEATERRARLTIKPGVSFVRGTLDVTVEILDLEPLIRYRIVSKGIGSTSEVAAAVAIADQESQSLLTWSVEIISLGGLLKAVPTGLVQAAARKVVADAVQVVAERISAPAT